LGVKRVVSVQDLLELEIKPDALLAEFYAITSEEVRARLLSDLHVVSCSGCGSTQSQTAFEKLGLTYRQCAVCATLYVSPRPTESSLIDYYRHSRAAQFWRERVLPVTDAVRAEKIIVPRAEWVLEGLAEYLPRAATGLDVSSHSYTLAQTLIEFDIHLARLIVANPLADVDFTAPINKVEVLPRLFSESIAPEKVDFMTAFDVVDRCPDLPLFVQAASQSLKVGGVLFLTAPSISGFDLQVLWDQSATITPPEKLNLLSVEGFRRLFPESHWEVCEFSTPGMFDAETVRRAVAAQPNGDWHRFIKYLLLTRGEDAMTAFQEFLQTYHLSSFMRAVLRKIA
jgi:hypothetical protein